MYISSVCIKVRRFRYKNEWFLDYQRAGVFFYYFGTVLQSVVCLLLICTVLDLFCSFCYGVALDWIFLFRACILGIYLTIWIIVMYDRALGSIFVLSWVNIMQHVYCKAYRKLKLNYLEGKDFCLQVLLLSFSFASLSSQCFVWNQGSDTRRELDWCRVFDA